MSWRGRIWFLAGCLAVSGLLAAFTIWAAAARVACRPAFLQVWWAVHRGAELVLDRTGGADSPTIDWRFTVGQRVKLRLVNQLGSTEGAVMRDSVVVAGGGIGGLAVSPAS